MRSPKLLFAVVTCAQGYAAAAQAGNDDAILIGGHAALTAGAITATVSDGSAAWYNPAGLAAVERQTLDINASAYGFSMNSAKGFITLPDGTRSDASVIDWQLIPCALSYVRQLGTHTAISFGIFIPTTTDIDLRSSVVQADGRRLTLGIDALRNEYDYIASIGTRIRDDLRFGVALQGIYISSENMSQVGLGTVGDPDASFLSYSNHRTVGDYGARIGLGVQWAPSPALVLGLALQTPTLTGMRKVQASEVSGTLEAGTKRGAFTSIEEDELEGVWELSTPLVVRVGAAYTLGRTQLMLDGTVSSPLESREVDRRFSGNLRAATLVQWSETLAVGLGVFTDLNGTRDPNANFLGLAGGVRLANDFHLVEGKRSLTFLTTLAGRYAYGFGTTEGISFAAANTVADLVNNTVRLRSHELAFNLGGGVMF